MQHGWMKMQGRRALPRLLGLVLIGFGLAIVLLGAYLVWNSLQARMALDAAADDVRRQAEQIEGRIASLRAAISSQQFVDATSSEDGQNDRNALVAALRDQGIGNVLSIVVASQDLVEIDLSSLPGGAFAALEMMLEARSEGSAPAQVHFAGTPDEYLAVAERLDAQDSRSPVVLVTLPVTVLANRIEMPQSVQAMRLVQVFAGETTTLEEFGGRSGQTSGMVPVEGSLLQLAWFRSSVIGPMSTGQLIGVISIGILLAILGVLIARRAGSGALVIRNETTPSDEPREKQPEGQKEQLRANSGPEKQAAAERQADSEPEAAPEPSSANRDRKSEAPDSQPSERAGKPVRQYNDEDPGFDDAPILGEAPVIPDDEPGRERLVQPEPQAPEVGEDAGSPAREDTESRDHPGTGEDDDFLSDTDAQGDDQFEMRRMLHSLVEEDGHDAETPVDKQAPESAEADVPSAPVVPPASIFRAYDIRGVVGDTLSPEIAEAIGRAIGSEARSKSLNRVTVARDGRLSGAEMLAALSRGLVAAGVDVIDVGAVPTPVLYYAAQELGGGSGVMITGSHNPPDYNGFKIVLGGETLAGDRITALHTRLVEGDLSSGKGQESQQSITVQYVDRIGTDIQLEKPLKVVADCGNGIAGAIAPRLLEAIGADVIPLYAEVDGTFPNHHPDPGDPRTLEDLRLCVRNFNADVGVAFDGDGDRLGVVSPDGEIIYPDRLMMLFARDVLSRNPGQPIIYDVKCSSLLAGEIEDAGGKPVMARTGHSFIKAQLKRDRAPLAGEMSGHFFFAERWYGFDDGMYAACRLLEILAADTRATGQILASLPKAESTPELKVEMKEGEPHPFVEQFAKSIDFEGAEINNIDGVRADFEDGFGLVRASNTTPVLVVRFEGTDKKALARIQTMFREAMLKVNPALKLPF